MCYLPVTEGKAPRVSSQFNEDLDQDHKAWNIFLMQKHSL